MKALDVDINWNKCGNLFTIFPIADTHLLADTDSKEAYQPLDYDAWTYLKKVAHEIKGNRAYYGRLFSLSLADLIEFERSSVRKTQKGLKKNDLKMKDTINKQILNSYIIPKLRPLVDGTEFLCGIAGNHLVEFFDQKESVNSDEYITKKLGGVYLGESKGLINFHICRNKVNSCLIRAVILHGTKGGSKQAIVRELQKLAYLYGKIDLVIMAHAHDPMAHFHCKYDLPDRADGKIQKHECLVVCVGSTRGGEKMGYDDYTERFNYPASAARFPIIIGHLYKPAHRADNATIKLRPLIM